MTQIMYKNGSTWGNLTLDAIYPIGSIYMSTNSTSPAQLFGGTWTQIKDRMILGVGDSYTSAEATGGSASVTIASSNLPTHTHSIGAHSHGLNSHKHSVPKHGHGNNISYSVNSSGAVSGGITGGSHGHALRTRNDSASAGYAWGRPGDYGQTEWEWSPIQASTHTHDLPNHTHTLTKSGGVSDCAAFNSDAASGNTANSSAFDSGNGGFANNALTTISPYYTAYIWKRTA